MSTTTTASDAAQLVESAKRAAAYQAVAEHLISSHTWVGIGSGSTVVYVVEAIAALGPAVTANMRFVPTGDQSMALVETAGLRLATLAQLPDGAQLDVAFDGADEVDEDLNLIKGGGACLFQEKVVATAAKKFVVVADYRKLSSRLNTVWKTGIPLEVLPLSAKRVLQELRNLGSPAPLIRQGSPGKAGPIVTDNGMWIVDAPFPPLALPSRGDPTADGTAGVWAVDDLADRLVRIPGIVETGVFAGKHGGEVQSGAQRPVAAYFGMADGSVQVKKAA